MTQADFEARHTLFQNEDKDRYIGKLLMRTIATGTVAIRSPTEVV